MDANRHTAAAVESRFAGRREDHRLTTGAGRYTDDHARPGDLQAVFLRADHAHARILSIDTAAAKAAPGVQAVLVAADLPGLTRGPVRMPFQSDFGPLLAPERPPLALDRVRHAGEPVALVVALTRAQAQDAAELIAVDYDPLPAVSDVSAALEPGAPQLFDEVPGNLCFTYPFGDAQAVEAAFADAAHRVTVTLDSGRVVANPMEPKAARAEWRGEQLHIWCPTQGGSAQPAALAASLGLDPERVSLHVDDVGGAFGVRGQTYPEYTALAEAARRLDRPVRWLASRSETFFSDFQGRGNRMTAELALDAEGRFLALRHDWLCDVGAHPSASGPVTVIATPTQMAGGAYRIPAIAGRHRLVLTNCLPTVAYRGAGRPDMAYVIERLVDEAARQTGIDRLELRRRNLIPASDFPYRITTAAHPASFDSADFARLLDRAQALSDWDGFAARRAESEARGKLRGIGCALFIEPAGGVSPTDQAALTVAADGAITLHTVVAASGQGHETVLPEVAARVLGIPPERITLAAAQPDGPVQRGGGAFGSRTMMSVGSVAVQAAEELLGRARGLAAAALDVAADSLTYADGAFHAAGNRFVSLDDLARDTPGALDTVAELKAPVAYPSGAHVAEVEIDPETGATDLLSYVSVDDCGTVVNRTLVLGQIMGGLAQGLGQVFGELCSYDEDGQMLSGSFMDYPMPRADLIGRLTIETLDQPSPGNRLGAKGVGEAGTVGALPTAMNAVADALASRGLPAMQMPVTPLRMWQALHPAG